MFWFRVASCCCCFSPVLPLPTVLLLLFVTLRFRFRIASCAAAAHPCRNSHQCCWLRRLCGLISTPMQLLLLLLGSSCECMLVIHSPVPPLPPVLPALVPAWPHQGPLAQSHAQQQWGHLEDASFSRLQASCSHLPCKTLLRSVASVNSPPLAQSRAQRSTGSPGHAQVVACSTLLGCGSGCRAKSVV
jgi:hypothetical protein